MSPKRKPRWQSVGLVVLCVAGMIGLAVGPKLFRAEKAPAPARTVLGSWRTLESEGTRARFETGRHYVRSGNWDQAIEFFSEVIRQRSHDAQAHFERALVYAVRGDVTNAMQDLTTALQLDPEHAVAWLARGSLRNQLGEFRDAIGDLSQVLNLATNATPSIPDMERQMRSLRGIAYVEVGEYDAAITDLSRAIELKADASGAFDLMWPYKDSGDLRRTNSSTQSALSSIQDWTRYYARGLAYSRLGQWENAVLDFSRAVRDKPDLAQAFGLRGFAFMKMGNLASAIDDFTTEIRLNPTNAGAYVSRGNAYRQNGELEKTLADYDDAMRLDAGNLDGAYNRGLVLIDLQEWQQAVSAFSKVIELNPKDHVALAHRGYALSKVGEVEKALEDYSSAIQLDPGNASLRSDRGFVFAEVGRLREAMRDHVEAVQMDPRHAAACNGIAWIQATSPDASLRNGAQAVEWARKACELTEWQNWSFVDTLAAACAEAGDFEQAIRYQKQALSMDGAKDDDKKEMQQRLSLFEKSRPFRDERSRSPTTAPSGE